MVFQIHFFNIFFLMATKWNPLKKWQAEQAAGSRHVSVLWRKLRSADSSADDRGKYSNVM